MNNNEINNLKIGQILNSRLLRDIFKVSNQGGMRRSLRTNSLVLISNHFSSNSKKSNQIKISDNVYTDQWKGEVFHYAGMGLKGDQDINFLQNKTVNESLSNGVNLYLFEVFAKGYFTFSGKVELCEDPYFAIQEDINGKPRQVCIFPLKKSEKKHNNISQSNAISELTVLDAILKSLKILGGEASLDEIYIEVNKLRDTPEPSIRARIYEHSKDCDAYNEKNPDLFMSTDGKGNGKWKLRVKNDLKKISSTGVNQKQQSHLNKELILDDQYILSKLNTKINIDILSLRARNICKQYDLIKFGNLAQLTYSESLRLQSMGKKTLEEFANLLAKNDLFFGMDIKKIQWELTDVPEEITKLISENENQFAKNITDAFKIIFKKKENSKEKKLNDKLIFDKRLQGFSLKEIGDDLGMTRERVRQIEKRVFNSIIDNLDDTTLKNQINEFHQIFSISRKPFYLYDIIKIIKVFEGVEELSNPEVFIKKVSDYASRKLNLNIISYEKIKGLTINFYSKKDHTLSYVELIKRVEKIYKKSILLQNDSKPSENDKILLEILKAGREDISGIIFSNLENTITSKSLNLSQQILLCFQEYDDLISIEKATKEKGLPRFNNIKYLRDNEVYEFKRGGWGEAKKFYLFKTGYEGIIADRIIAAMRANPSKQYHASKLIDIIKPDLEYLSDFPDKINDYQLDVCLTKSLKLGKPIYDLGRRYWSLENMQRKKTRHLVYQSLHSLNKISHFTEIMDDINNIKDVAQQQFHPDENLEHIGSNFWSLVEWRGTKPDSFFKEYDHNIIKKRTPNGKLRNRRSLQYIEDLNLLNFIKKYIKENGHCDMSSKYTEDGIPYGIKIYNIRRKYLSGTMHEEVIEYFEKIQGWTWSNVKENRKKLNLDEIISYLKEFQKENNHCDIKNRAKTPNGFTIGRWVESTRIKFQYNKLEPSLIETLEGIDGWVWSSRNLRGQDKANIDNLKNFVINYSQENGNINIPSSYMMEGENYGGKIYRLRQRYASGSLDQDSIDTMEEIDGWEWEHHNKSENRKKPNLDEIISYLKEFQKENNHCDIKFKTKTANGYTIGRWVDRTRRKFHNNELEPSLVEILEGIDGWVWSSGNKRGNIEDLKNFIINYSKENGNINIPASYLSNGKNHGGKIYRLRQRYASGSLDQASIDTMEEIEGWEWEHHKKAEKVHSTEEAVTAIKKFQKREGHLNIPVGHLEDDVNIYNYKFSKIRRYKTNKLSDKIISLLEEVPGWKW